MSKFKEININLNPKEIKDFSSFVCQNSTLLVDEIKKAQQILLIFYFSLTVVCSIILYFVVGRYSIIAYLMVMVLLIVLMCVLYFKMPERIKNKNSKVYQKSGRFKNRSLLLLDTKIQEESAISKTEFGYQSFTKISETDLLIILETTENTFLPIPKTALGDDYHETQTFLAKKIKDCQ